MINAPWKAWGPMLVNKLSLETMTFFKLKQWKKALAAMYFTEEGTVIDVRLVQAKELTPIVSITLDEENVIDFNAVQLKNEFAFMEFRLAGTFRFPFESIKLFVQLNGIHGLLLPASLYYPSGQILHPFWPKIDKPV